jgi:hypothetical protein
MQQVFTDFGFGPYPGTLEYLGATLIGVRQDQNAYADMTKNSGPLTLPTVPVQYRITSSNNEATRKTKCYKWIMDQRLTALMPNAQPAINSADANSYAYWERYIDYVIWQSSAGSRGTIPAIVNTSRRITSLANPQKAGYPTITAAVPQGFRNKFGYRTYVSFMMDHGRDVAVVGSTYSPLSTSSPLCPYHSEAVGEETFDFPPREQPTHASRRSLIAAMQVVDEMNAGLAAAHGQL